MLGFLGKGSAVSASIAVPILSTLSVTFFGADSVVSEYESKTGYFLFPNPIKKAAIFFGKFIASALVSVGTIGLFYLIAAMSVRVVDGSIPVNTGSSFAYAFVYLFAILAVAYFFSAIMRSSVYSLVLTFFTFFLILPIVDAVGSVAKFKPWFVITFASLISQYIFQNPYPTDKVLNATAVSLVAYYPDVRLSLAVMAAYFVVAFLLAIVLARRREMYVASERRGIGRAMNAVTLRARFFPRAVTLNLNCVLQRIKLTYRLADREKRAIAYRESWLTPTLLDHLLLGLPERCRTPLTRPPNFRLSQQSV